MGRPVSVETGIPIGFAFRAFVVGVPACVDVFGYLEGRMRPADALTGRGDFVVAEGGAVAFFFAFFVGRAPADDGLAANQRRFVGDRAGFFQGFFDGFGIVPVDFGNDVPAVGFKAFRGIVHEPARGVAVSPHFSVDGDVVVVVDGYELAQFHRTGQRAGFVRDAFHQAAVAQKGVGVMVDNGMARTVELPGQRAFRDSKTDGIGYPLTQRTRGGFHAGRVAVFGMPWRSGVQLAEILEFFDRQVIAG